jgi:predicted aldo/keto reductase-like oxidoreductase
MKFSAVVLLGLILMACQKEPEIVNVNKVIKCFSSKAENKKEFCAQLNKAEQKVLDCVTSKNIANNECQDVSMTDMTFFMERERQPAKRRGTQFDFHQDRDAK